MLCGSWEGSGVPAYIPASKSLPSPNPYLYFKALVLSVSLYVCLVLLTVVGFNSTSCISECLDPAELGTYALLRGTCLELVKIQG